MENTQSVFNCAFCDQNLKDDWYKTGACRYVGLKVVADFQYRLCRDCYPKVQYAVRQALNGVLKTMLLEATAEIKQELQAAGKI